MNASGRSITVGAVVRLNVHDMKRHVRDRVQERIRDKNELHGSFKVCEIVAGHATLQSTRGMHVTVPKDILIPIPN